jgi:hypothetical protein
MKPDILEGTRKQFGYLRLEQPNCFAVKADVYPHHAIWLINNNLVLVSVHLDLPFMAHIIPSFRVCFFSAAAEKHPDSLPSAANRTATPSHDA